MLKRLFYFNNSNKEQRQQTIGTKLLLIFVGLVMLLGAALGIVSYRIAATALIAQAQEASEQSINLAGEKLDMKQQFYVDLSKQLSNNSRFIDHMLQITIPELKQDERSRRMAEMRTMLGQLALSDSSIRDITLIPLEDPIETMSSNQDITSVDSDSPWIELVREHGGAPLWLPISEQAYIGSSNKPVVAYGRLLGRNNIGSNDFVLLVQLDAAFVGEMIADVRLGTSGSTAVLNGMGELMTSNVESDLSADSRVFDTQMSQLFENQNVSAIIGQYESLPGLSSIRSGEQLAVFRTSALSGWTIVGTVSINELTEAANEIKNMTVWVLACSVIIAIGSGLMLVVSIRRPLKELERMMTAAATGDFRNRMKQQSRDEIGRVATGYNRMMEQLASFMTELRQIVLQLAQSTGQIALAATNTDQAAKETRMASEQIAFGAVELASNAEQGGHRIADMNEIIRIVAGLQGEVSQAAVLAHQSGFQGEAAAKQLHAAVNSSELKIVAVNNQIMNLTEVTSSIEQLLQLMQQLSKKIKVLSLNATIEAVRAGRAGAGFKVIADEIRMLAEQSNDSIEKAGIMTAQIVQEVHSAVSAVQVVLPTVHHMVTEVFTVEQAIQTMRERSEQVRDSSEEFTSVLEQLQQTQVVLAVTMEGVSAVSQQSSASTEQVASLCNQQALIGDELVQLSHTLTAASEQLEQQMSRFKLE